MVLSYMQKLDMGYSNHENFKNYYITIIVKATLLALIFLFSSLIISAVTSFMRQNRESFNYMIVYANVDSKLRSLIQLINNESYSILMLGIYNYYLALVPPNSPLLIPIKFLTIDITTRLRAGLNKKDLVPFIQNRVDRGIESFIESYESSKLKISENILDRDTILGMMRISSSMVGPLGLDVNMTFINPVQYDNFINRYLIASMTISPFLQDLRKYTDGQEPPFAINDPPLLVRFVNLVVTMINQVASGSAGILPKSLASIQAAATLMTQTSINGLKQYTLYMSFGFFAVAGLYTAYVLTVFWMVKRKLFSYLTILESFKNEEIVLHAAICQAHHKAFSANKFKEELMIAEYMQCGKADTKGLLLSQRHNEDGGVKSERVKSDERRPVRMTQAQKTAAQRKHVRVQLDQVFSAPFVESVLGCVTFVFLVALYVANLAIQQQVYSSLNTQTLFFDYYRLSAEMKEYVLNTNLMLIYGNYIKVDGKYVEDIPDSMPGRAVASFWMEARPTLPQYFSEADASKIDSMLTQDLCPLVNMIADEEERTTMAELCESYIPTKKGMYSLWTSMEDLCADNRLYMLTSQKVFMNSSRTVFGFSPSTSVLFSKQNIQTRYLYNSLLELFIDQLFSIMDSTLARKFSSIENSLQVLTWVGVTGQVLLIICAFTITFKLLRVNTEICRETYANILPETIFQNQHIHQAFKNHFVKNK